jgi:hypothetical protein
MPLTLSYSSHEGEVRRSLEELQHPIASALAAAMKEAGDLIRKRGRDNIRQSGLGSRRWIEGLQVQVTPADSFDASLRVFHRIGFAGIFEEGGTITGKPLLWLPINANLPDRRGRRWTPRQYVRQVGPLYSARAAKRPILVGKPPGKSRAVPVFFGVRSVEIQKRFNIAGIVEDVANDFEQIYAKHLRYI